MGSTQDTKQPCRLHGIGCCQVILIHVLHVMQMDSAHVQTVRVCSAHGWVHRASQLTLCRCILHDVLSVAECDANLMVAAPAHLHPLQGHLKCCRAADALWALGHKGRHMWRLGGRFLQHLLA